MWLRRAGICSKITNLPFTPNNVVARHSRLKTIQRSIATTGKSLHFVDIGPFLKQPRIPPGTDLEKAKAATANAMRKKHIAHFLLNRQLDVSDLAKACEECGFFYVQNHGFDEDIREKAHKLARRFFSLPMDAKMRLSVKIPLNIRRGYQPIGKNVAQGRPEMHEALDLMREFSEADAQGQGAYAALLKDNANLEPFVLGRNHWPPETFFESTLTSNSFWSMRIMGYPPMQRGALQHRGGSVGCGEHAHYGCLTIVNQDNTATALQVKDRRTNEWVFASPVKGAFVINIGDMFDIWTGGKYKSTPYRVIHEGVNYRTSIPFFYEPNADALVTCLLPDRNDSRQVIYSNHLYTTVTNNDQRVKKE